MPPFRGGANLVVVDAFVSKANAAITDLTPGEIEVLEDDQPQSIEAVRVVKPGARVFALFFDHGHLDFDGSSKAAAPVLEVLDRVINPGDLVGVMRPEVAAPSVPLAPRGSGLDQIVRELRTSSDPDRVDDSDPVEKEIASCYPDTDAAPAPLRGFAREVIERRREQRTLRALDDLIAHLGRLRDERKYVVLLSGGWPLFRQSQSLGAVFEPTKAQANDRVFESCERERSMLAFIDDAVELRQLAQRANRANVTFIVIDPRGLSSSDDAARAAAAVADREKLAVRQGGLRELAGTTGGVAILNSSEVKSALLRVAADTAPYYLLKYYSTNTVLDGKYRAIAVRVNRPAVQIRARSGYLAPTAAEAIAGGVPAKPAALPDGVVPLIRRPRITALRRGPSTGLKYVRVDGPTFRRTERLRIEWPLPPAAAHASGQVLNKQDQPLPLIVSYSTEQVSGRTIGIAEVILAPLAIGEYRLMLSFDVSGEQQSLVYDFRIIP